MLNRLSSRVLHRKLSDHSVDVDNHSPSLHGSSVNSPLLKPTGSLRTGVGLDGSTKIDVICSLTVGDKCSCGPPRLDGGTPGHAPRHTDSPRRRRAGETQLRLDEELERRNSCGNATNEYTKRAGNGNVHTAGGSSLDDIKKTTSAGEVGQTTSSSLEKDSSRNENYDSPQKMKSIPAKSYSKPGEQLDVTRAGKSDGPSCALKGGRMFGEGKKRSSGCSDYTPLNFDVNYVKVSPPKMTRRPKRESPPKISDMDDSQLLKEGFTREMMIRLGRSPPCRPNPEETTKRDGADIKSKESGEGEANASRLISCISDENIETQNSLSPTSFSKEPELDDEIDSPTVGSLESSSGLSEADDRPSSGSVSDYLCWDDVRAQLTNEISDARGKPGFELSGCDPERLISLINSADMNDEKLNDSITLVKDGSSSLLQFVFTLRLDKDSLKAAASQAMLSETGGPQKLIDTGQGLDSIDGCSSKISGRVNIVKEDGVTQIGSLKVVKPSNDGDPIGTSTNHGQATNMEANTSKEVGKVGQFGKKASDEVLNCLNDVDRNVSKFDSSRIETLAGMKNDLKKPQDPQSLSHKLQQSESSQIKNIYSPTRKRNSGQVAQKCSIESKETWNSIEKAGSSSIEPSGKLKNRKEVRDWQTDEGILSDRQNKTSQSSDGNYNPTVSTAGDRSKSLVCDDDLRVDRGRECDREMTHMSWDEVMNEARTLGIPLNRGGGSSAATLSRKPGRALREPVRRDESGALREPVRRDESGALREPVRRDESVECLRRSSITSLHGDVWSPVADDINMDTKMNSSWACPSCLTGMPTPADLALPEQGKELIADQSIVAPTGRRWGSPLKEKIQNFFCRRSKPSVEGRVTRGSSGVMVQDQQQKQLLKQQQLHRQQSMAAKQSEHHKVSWCTTVPCRQATRASSCRPADRQACSTISSPRAPGCSVVSSSRGNKVTTTSPLHRGQTSCRCCSCEAVMTSPSRGCAKTCRECSTISPKRQPSGRCSSTSWTSPRRCRGSAGMASSQGDLCKECVHQRGQCDKGQASPMSPSRKVTENQGCVVLDMGSPLKAGPGSRIRGTARSSTPGGSSRMRSETPDMDCVDSRTQPLNPGGSLSPRKNNSAYHASVTTRTSTHTTSGTGSLTTGTSTHTAGGTTADYALDGGTEAGSNVNFFKSLAELQGSPWYWGAAGFEEAESILEGREDGSFLVRDSSDPRYILSLSFRSLGSTHHTRIEHYKGKFSFYAQQHTHEAGTIVEFIESAVRQSVEGKCLYYLRPRAPGLNPAPVLLLHPILRD